MKYSGAFRALREMAGFDQAQLADMLEVGTEKIAEWENPNEGEKAPDEAFDYLHMIMREQHEMIDAIFDYVSQVEEFIGHAPETVDMVYYADQSTYSAHHPSNDPRLWPVANAATRYVAASLLAEGIIVNMVLAGYEETEATKMASQNIVNLYIEADCDAEE